MHDSRILEIASELESLADELADIGRSLLSEAIGSDNEDQAAALAAREKRVAQARRAVTKAASVLGGEARMGETD